MLDLPTAQRLVGLAGLAFQVHHCSRLAGGANSAAFDLYDAGRDAHVVAKVYSERLAWKMGKEVYVYDLLRPAGAPTPTVLFADDSRQAIDANWVLMTKLDGTPASAVTPTASPNEVRDLFRQMGEVMRACHAVHLDRFGYIGPAGLVDAEVSNQAYVHRQLERHVRTFRDDGGDATTTASVARAVASADTVLANCDQAVLCHDDLHEQNVLVERRGSRWDVTGVVDVENAVAADPLLDVAKTDYYARCDPLRRSGLLEGYGRLPDDAEARLALYRLHHALALWAWFSRIGHVEPLPGIAEDIDRFADVVTTM